MTRKRFWTNVPSHDNAVDLFEGAWVSDLAEVMPSRAHAGTPLFALDYRPRQAATALGVSDRFDGMNILELGPLEGAHSYQLEQLGSTSVMSIEANAEAFLRCLVVKNILSLDKTTFYLGDCVDYLKTTDRSFDVIFACGILYHMEDPIELIKLVALHTTKLFLWTQYYDPAFRDPKGHKLKNKEKPYTRDGLDLPVYERVYRNRFRTDFLGGNRLRTNWLSMDGILAALRHYGFDTVTILEEKRDGAYGPAVTLAATRNGPVAMAIPAPE